MPTSRCTPSLGSGAWCSATWTAPIDFLAHQPQNGFDVHGNPLQCRATTRKGTPCQRMPLPHNGYCPSHQHLAETEEIELVASGQWPSRSRRSRAPVIAGRLAGVI